MNNEKDEDFVNWTTYPLDKGNAFDVFARHYYWTMEITPRLQFSNHYVNLPPVEAFLLQRIYVAGLTSNDVYQGTIEVQDWSTGRLVLDQPLHYYALRNNRRLSMPWFFQRCASISVAIRYSEGAEMGNDFTGNPRTMRRLYIHLLGQGARLIQ